MPIQQKSQIVVDAADEGGANFASFESQRCVAKDVRNNLSNMPPGMDMHPDDTFGEALAGENDVSDGIDKRSLAQGFARKPTETTDPSNGDAMALFYDRVDVDGATGFVERNNYLDRC